MDFADIVQKCAGHQQVAVDHVRIVSAGEIAKVEQRDHMVQQAANVCMMQGLGCRGVLVSTLDLWISHKGLDQRLEMRVAKVLDVFAHRPPKLVDVLGGPGQVVVKINFRVCQAAHLVDGELEPSIEFVQQSADFDKVILIECSQVLIHVVPHLGLKLAGAIGNRERQVELAALFGLDLFGGDDKRGGNDLVLELSCVANVEVFHGL